MAKSYDAQRRKKEREAAEQQAKRAEQTTAAVVVAETTAAPITPKPSVTPTDRGAGVSPASGQATRLPQGNPQQERARFALERIRALAEKWQDDQKKQKEFNSHASTMPFMIRANGLGQTAAFYRRKGEGHLYFQLYKLLGDWLAKPEQPFKGRPDLLTAITQSDQDAYLAAQIESLLFLDWVKKLASAFLAREEEEAPLPSGERPGLSGAEGGWGEGRNAP
ncbi:type III-B CRISPR module-associated protein Cmr5 [uncultured Thiocystis sp.]|jgi:CRISPR-associated protein Cmr5|uniref:type III-B CRISPR module-associated protein Cmr5 n=1 Tax=uncultured Thiocystis sp. TaxID=1202134 RepID=UPI0025FA25E0|nr:type III-B CRISPR module-associated protein Cmr5 [uncultured Thiocystis sp.]